MAALIFDTLRFSKQLRMAGIPAAKAEAETKVLAEFFETNLKDLVTKEDLFITKESLQHEIKDLRNDFGVLRHDVGELQNDMKALRHDVGVLQNDVKVLQHDVGVLKNDVKTLQHDVKDLRHEMKNMYKDLDAKIERVYIKLSGEMSMIKWMFGVMIASTIGILTKLFF